MPSPTREIHACAHREMSQQTRPFPGCVQPHAETACALFWTRGRGRDRGSGPQQPAGYPGGPCCTQACRCTAYPELLHAIVDAALVLVDVGPGVAGGALWGDVPRRGLGDAVEPSEKAHLHSTRGRPPQHACTNGNASTPATFLSHEAPCVRAARTPRHPHTFSSTMPRGTGSKSFFFLGESGRRSLSYRGQKAQMEISAKSHKSFL